MGSVGLGNLSLGNLDYFVLIYCKASVVRPIPSPSFVIFHFLNMFNEGENSWGLITIFLPYF